MRAVIRAGSALCERREARQSQREERERQTDRERERERRPARTCRGLSLPAAASRTAAGGSPSFAFGGRHCRRAVRQWRTDRHAVGQRTTGRGVRHGRRATLRGAGAQLTHRVSQRRGGGLRHTGTVSLGRQTRGPRRPATPRETFPEVRGSSESVGKRQSSQPQSQLN